MWASLLVAVAFVSEVTAASVAVTSFTQLVGGRFFDVGAPQYPGSLVVDSLTITQYPPSPGAQFGGFIVFPRPMGTPDDPGDGAGTAFATQNYVIDFRPSLAAFGVSFYHSSTDNGMAFPAVLTVYDGAHGSGSPIGSVTSSGGNRRIDFVGVWSDSRDIRSAVLFGTSEYKGFQVYGLGISFTPIPEPSMLSLIALGIVGMAFHWRKTFGVVRIGSPTIRSVR